MPIDMKHARRIAGSATQSVVNRNVRMETASNASGKSGTVASREGPQVSKASDHGINNVTPIGENLRFLFARD